MPRKKTLWFRFYVEAIHDRKLRRQDPAVRWLWVVILAVARRSPQPGYLLVSDEGDGFDPMTIEDLADDAAMKLSEVRKGVETFTSNGMLTHDDDVGALFVTKWWDRQFESDDTAARTAKHRSRERSNNAGGNVPTTPEGTASSRARDPRASQALATEAETEAEELPPQPPADAGGASASGDKLNPRAAGTNPRAQAKRQQQTTSRLEGARSRGRTLALGGSSRTDVITALDRDYNGQPELYDAALAAYDAHHAVEAADG